MDFDIAETSFRRVSAELEKVAFELRKNEKSIHRIVSAAPWSLVSEEVSQIQSLDKLIQTLSALSHYTGRMANGVNNRVEHDAVVADLTLADVRERLIGGRSSSTDVESEIELF